MEKPDSVTIESLEQFSRLLRTSTVGVFWSVHCEIGPDWIGGGRDVELLCDGKHLSGEFCDRLISAIIAAASIPGDSDDSVISGEGEISCCDTKLILEFEWNAAVPYDFPHDSGHGRVELLID